MDTQIRQAWKAALLIVALGLWIPAPAIAADVLYEADPLAQYVAFADGEAASSNDVMVAEAGKNLTVIEESQNGDNGAAKIEVTFGSPEEDILTLQALDKLEIVVESLEFSNADLYNVIRLIGERLDINFIFDASNISGKVTLRLRNVRLRDALESILSTRNLAIVADRSGIFRIVPKEQVGRASVETRTEVIQLNWVAANDITKTMEPFLTTDIGKIQFNEESNVVIVTDVPPQVQVIRDLIEQIDLPERQVLIETRLAEINVGAILSLGTDWALSKPNENNPGAVIDPGALSTIFAEGFGFNGVDGGTIALGDTLGILGNTYNLDAVFSMLEEQNVAEILANPRIATLNNMTAHIAINEEIPYITTKVSQGVIEQEVHFKDAGVTLDVKPIIAANGNIRLNIDLVQQVLTGFQQFSAEGGIVNEVPIIDQREAKNSIIVKDKETALLGGLRQVRKSETGNVVPWFNRIPVLGWLFKNKVTNQKRTELVLMITPRITTEGEVLKASDQFLYDRIDTQWHRPDYHDDDVSSMIDLTVSE